MPLEDVVELAGVRPFLTLRRYEGPRPRSEERAPLPLEDGAVVVLGARTAALRINIHLPPDADGAGVSEGAAGAVGLLELTFAPSAPLSDASVGVDLDVSPWSPDVYVLLPGAVYAGNRFPARATGYPPILRDPADLGPDAPTIISDVPRLSDSPSGPSRLQLLARDLATPCVAFFDPDRSLGFALLTDERTVLGATGLYVAEADGRSGATVSVAAPGVREGVRYRGNRLGAPSEDRGGALRPDEPVTLRLRLYAFACADVPALFAHFCGLRQALPGAPARDVPAAGLPLSAAFALQEEKYNRQNWATWPGDEAAERDGHYAVGTGWSREEGRFEDWQPGWTGGLIATHPLLLHGSGLSRARARATFDWLFREGQAPSGLFRGVGHRGIWHDDSFSKAPAGTGRWHLVRKSADVLYFAIKQFDLLRRRGEAPAPPWEAGVRRCADAFVGLWERHGQFGHFADEDTGRIIVGGSASAGIAPAGLALAAAWFGEPHYLRVARESARSLYERCTRRGVTTGGPGDALQNPDSESAYGLLESFVVLYEAAGDRAWLPLAEEAARQCASWHVSYDFAFPPDSEFGRLDLRSAGAVMANVQNKHGAPGVCTLSGDSLLKLSRATGDVFYLDLLRETVRNLPQYLSRSDRPIRAKDGRPLPPGWMNERVNLSDWDDNVGGVFYGSTWAEVSLMLAFAEVPGVYVQPDTGLVRCFDAVEARMLEAAVDSVRLEVTNPTAFPARVTVLAETSRESRRRRLGPNALLALPAVEVGAGQTAEAQIALPPAC